MANLLNERGLVERMISQFSCSRREDAGRALAASHHAPCAQVDEADWPDDQRRHCLVAIGDRPNDGGGGRTLQMLRRFEGTPAWSRDRPNCRRPHVTAGGSDSKSSCGVTRTVDADQHGEAAAIHRSRMSPTISARSRPYAAVSTSSPITPCAERRGTLSAKSPPAHLTTQSQGEGATTGTVVSAYPIQ